MDSPDDFRSVNQYLGQLKPDELRILHEQLSELSDMPAFKSLGALLRLDREQHVRRMTAGKVLTHPEYAFEGGYVRGTAIVFALLAAVESKHRATQQALHAALTNDGES